MTFNRYIAFRMALEIVGAISCAVLVFVKNDLAGFLVTGVIALLWIVGEIVVITMFNRSNPRTDELSDRHQYAAVRFSFMTLVGALTIIGFAGMISSLAMHAPWNVSPMLLPTLAMLALSLSDARYLWLESDGLHGGDDED
ncbi:hypothetical protein JS533_007825 [Bifidobacterium amazonense]|uniref:Uncharacterized protein n=1 Tax=Bifidobacterium amazonense TaxID=2809027 RepID=A0ABS9VVN7_9BIFI|nr:hypothetical protein [Bifidobacterium amazonense]MCH9276177.1 hypothetical protein [Bifidobacterium amazonense]